MRTGDSRLHPTIVAALDQHVAYYTEWINELVESYDVCLSATHGELVTLGALAALLEDDFDPATLGSLLAVAVRMLHGRPT